MAHVLASRDGATASRTALRLHLARLLWRALPLTLGCVAGFAWGQESVASLTWIVLVFAGWWRARTRLEAWLVMATYHALAARGLVVGASRYFQVPMEWAAVIVLGGALLACVPWWALWSSRGRAEPFWIAFARVSAALVASLVPPLAALNVSSPVIAAGVWFPGTSLWGLLGIACVACGLRASIASWPGLWGVAFLAVWLRAGTTPQAAPDGVLAVRTEQPTAPLADLVAQYRQSRAVMAQLSRDPRARATAVIALPENAAGLWTPSAKRLWQPLALELAARSQAALVGATRRDASGALSAIAVALPGRDQTYAQRVPMPIAMWRPWERPEASFRPHWWGPGTLALPQRVGVLICWEIGTPWAVIGSVLEGAKALVGLANVAWLRGTSAAHAEQQALASWSALFDLPAVLALNE